MHAYTLREPKLKPIFEDIEAEVLSARKKFPSNKMMLHALHEEVGELAQAMLNQYHIHKERSIELDSPIYKEAVQVAAMAIRVMTEGDSNFPYNPAGVRHDR